MIPLRAPFTAACGLLAAVAASAGLAAPARAGAAVPVAATAARAASDTATHTVGFETVTVRRTAAREVRVTVSAKGAKPGGTTLTSHHRDGAVVVTAGPLGGTNRFHADFTVRTVNFSGDFCRSGVCRPVALWWPMPQLAPAPAASG